MSYRPFAFSEVENDPGKNVVGPVPDLTVEFYVDSSKTYRDNVGTSDKE